MRKANGGSEEEEKGKEKGKAEGTEWMNRDGREGDEEEWENSE